MGTAQLSAEEYAFSIQSSIVNSQIKWTVVNTSPFQFRNQVGLTKLKHQYIDENSITDILNFGGDKVANSAIS